MDDAKDKSPEDNKNIKHSEWNSKLEDAAQGIGQSAQGYKHMHIWQAQRASKKHHCLMGTGIILGPTASVISSIGLAFGLSNEPTISVLTILLGFMSGILIATVRFGKFDEVSSANKSAAARYTSIESNVRRQLGLYRKDRIEAVSYMDWLETKYEELFMSAPLLPAGSYTKFSAYAKKNGIPIPAHYDHMISINTEKINDEQPCKKKIEIVIENKITSEVSEKTDDVSETSSEESKRKVGRKSIKRKNTMGKIPQLNQCSDKMLVYEMKRMMGEH